MTYRDDVDALRARIETFEGEVVMHRTRVAELEDAPGRRPPPWYLLLGWAVAGSTVTYLILLAVLFVCTHWTLDALWKHFNALSLPAAFGVLALTGSAITRATLRIEDRGGPP